jgi:uncharacterized coiled-coil protein SlyX
LKPKTAEDRILELETSLAHVERRCEALNEVVIEQGRTIHRLQTQMRRLTDTIEQQELDRVRSVASKPPHHQP